MSTGVKTLYLNVTSVSKFICKYPVYTEKEKINELTKYNNWLFQFNPNFKIKEETLIDLVSNLNEEEIKNLDEVFKTDVLTEPGPITGTSAEDEIHELANRETKQQETSRNEEEPDVIIKQGTAQEEKREMVTNITQSINKNIEKIVNNGGEYVNLINSIANNNIKKIIRSKIYTKIGIKEEENDVKEFEKQRMITVKKDNRLYKKTLLTINCKGVPIRVLIGGRIDGRIDKTTILESKRRLNRLFDDIPFYEKIQMELYCYIINDVNKCIHVQNYNNKKKIITYTQNDGILNYIKETLEDSIKKLLLS